MANTKEKKYPVLWWDDEYWGDPVLPVSELPENAKGIEDDRTGEWTFVIEREKYNGNGGDKGEGKWVHKDGKGWEYDRNTGKPNGNYKYQALNLPVLGEPKEDIHPSALYRVTGLREMADLFKMKSPDTEAIQKGLLIAFVISALVFAFLLVVVLVGD